MGHFKEASNWCDGGGVSHSCGPCPRPAFCPATPCPPLLLCSTPFLGPIASCLLLCWCAVRFTSSSRLAIERMSTCTHASVRTSSPHMCDNGGPGGLHLSACFSPARLWLRRGGVGFGVGAAISETFMALDLPAPSAGAGAGVGAASAPVAVEAVAAVAVEAVAVEAVAVPEVGPPVEAQPAGEDKDA